MTPPPIRAARRASAGTFRRDPPLARLTLLGPALSSEPSQRLWIGLVRSSHPARTHATRLPARLTRLPHMTFGVCRPRRGRAYSGGSVHTTPGLTVQIIGDLHESQSSLCRPRLAA